MLGVALQHLGRFDEAYRHFLRVNEAIIFTQYEAVVRKVAKQRGAPPGPGGAVAALRGS
jgi:hypothetical protein